MTTAQQTEINEALRLYFREHFNGDLDAISLRAAEWAVTQRWVRGPLWEEMGAEFCRSFFRSMIQGERRQRPAPLADEAPNGPRERARPSAQPDSVYARWFEVSGRWMQLGDMTKAECRIVEASYDALVRANANKADFFRRVGDGLTSAAQTVRERYSPDELLRLEREEP